MSKGFTNKYYIRYSDNYSDDCEENDERASLIRTTTKNCKVEKAAMCNLSGQSEERDNDINGDADETHGPSDANASVISDEDTIRMLKDQYEKYGEEFQSMVYEALRAIGNGVYPVMIPQGSSGSYFVMNMNRERIAVFKPKNEEPYGQLNPKWLKWFHKFFFPCCFGRSCLVPNQVYIYIT